MQHSWGKPSRNGWRTIAMSSKSKHLHGALGSPMSFWLWYWCLARSVKKNIYIYLSQPMNTRTHTGLHWSTLVLWMSFLHLLSLPVLLVAMAIPESPPAVDEGSNLPRGAIFRWNVRNISSSGRWNDWNDQLQNSDVWMYILYIYIIMYMIYIYIYI